MINKPAPIPRLPPAAKALIKPLPMPVLSLLMNRLARQSVARYPSIFARLGSHVSKSFLIDPTDLPFVFLLHPVPDAPKIYVHRRPKSLSWDGRIAGPLAALLGMVHGAYDGDALFFSRDIVLEGDTAAVLALRNAIDDCELDLVEECTALLGPFGSVALPAALPVINLLQNRFNVALRRVEPCS